MKPIVVANWKANKTLTELEEWVKETKDGLAKFSNVEIIVCPPFISLDKARELFQGTNIKLGAQTVSNKPSGAFTGEVPAELLSNLVSHCIVGHSERRRYFAEDSEQIADKIEQLLNFGIIPILCISDLDQLDEYFSVSQTFEKNSQRIIFVYEPPNAISGGLDYRPEDLDSVQKNVQALRDKVGGEVAVLYGGSVNKEIISEYFAKGKINGVLIGKASLDSKEFVEINRSIASTVL